MVRSARHSLFLLVALVAITRMGSAEIFLLPKSDKVFRIQVEFPATTGKKPEKGKKPENEKATLLVREGSLAIVANKDTGVRVGFSPTLTPTGVQITSFKIEKGAENDDKAVNPMGFLETTIGGPAKEFFQLVGPRISLRVLSVAQGSFDTPPYEGTPDYSNPDQMEALRAIYGAESNAICCVGCGPIIVCANAVDLSCGVCDSAGHHRI